MRVLNAININNVVKVPLGQTDTALYTVIYENEAFSYCVKTQMWQSYLDILDMVDTNSLNLIKGANLFTRVIPTYGKPLFVLLSMVSIKVVDIHVLEDVLNAMVVDNYLILSVIEELKSHLKNSKVYMAMEEKMNGIAGDIEQYKMALKSISSENAQLKEQNKKLQAKVKRLEILTAVKDTPEWEDETRLPILRNFSALNQMLLKRDSELERVDIGKNTFINVPEDINPEFKDFLIEKHHYILEFIAVKFQQLIPYVKRYYELKEANKK